MTTPRVLNLAECLVRMQVTRFKVPQNGGFRGLKEFVCTQQGKEEEWRGGCPWLRSSSFVTPQWKLQLPAPIQMKKLELLTGVPKLELGNK
jgi:hypothetical protein